MSFTLTSPLDGDAFIAQLFELGDARPCRVFVSEEQCFGIGKYLPLGSIQLKQAENTDASCRMAIRRGEFEWSVPDSATTLDAACKLLDIDAPSENTTEQKRKAYEKARDRVRRTLDSTAS